MTNVVMGAQEAPEGAYNFDILAADVIGLMDELSIARAHFCGLSMGGITAQALVQKYPDRFDKLIICDCTGASSPARCGAMGRAHCRGKRRRHGRAGRHYCGAVVLARSP